MCLMYLEAYAIDMDEAENVRWRSCYAAILLSLELRRASKKQLRGSVRSLDQHPPS
jgi:hypothetical protein